MFLHAVICNKSDPSPRSLLEEGLTIGRNLEEFGDAKHWEDAGYQIRTNRTSNIEGLIESLKEKKIPHATSWDSRLAESPFMVVFFSEAETLDY